MEVGATCRPGPTTPIMSKTRTMVVGYKGEAQRRTVATDYVNCMHDARLVNSIILDILSHPFKIHHLLGFFLIKKTSPSGKVDISKKSEPPRNITRRGGDSALVPSLGLVMRGQRGDKRCRGPGARGML